MEDNLYTDRYGSYCDLLQEITAAGCWAHAGRRFVGAMKSLLFHTIRVFYKR